MPTLSIADVRARTAARKAAGANQTYPEHAKGGSVTPPRLPSRPLPPRSLPLLSECPLATARLRGCTTCGDYTPEEREGRAVYRCEHPENDRAECTRGNPRSGLWTCASCEHHPDYRPPVE